jgi:hypothetical protein
MVPKGIAGGTPRQLSGALFKALVFAGCVQQYLKHRLTAIVPLVYRMCQIKS